MTNRQRVLKVFQDARAAGQWLSSVNVSDRAKCQHDTAMKNKKRLADEGWVFKSKRIKTDCGHYFVYFLIGHVSEQNNQINKTIERYRKIQNGYPTDHIQYAKIGEQIEMLEKYGNISI